MARGSAHLRIRCVCHMWKMALPYRAAANAQARAARHGVRGPTGDATCLHIADTVAEETPAIVEVRGRSVPSSTLIQQWTQARMSTARSPPSDGMLRLAASRPERAPARCTRAAGCEQLAVEIPPCQPRQQAEEHSFLNTLSLAWACSWRGRRSRKSAYGVYLRQHIDRLRGRDRGL